MKYHDISDESLAEFKKISDEKGIKYESELEMKQSAQNLVGLVDLLIEMDMAQRALKKRLETEPKGFSMEGVKEEIAPFAGRWSMVRRGGMTNGALNA